MFPREFIKKNILLIGALIIPAIIAITTLFHGDFTLWYDPARDLLTAWDNLSKLTLIGPPTGIPSIFYGPYWIWLLSFGLLFSKNPLIVTFITATIPYLILFPLIWFRLSKVFDRTSLILGWLLFILGKGMTYSTQLWNPYPAPLLTVAALILFITADLSKVNKKTLLTMLSVGFLLGLVVNFHISFGITLLLGVFLFLILDTFIFGHHLPEKRWKILFADRFILSSMIALGIGLSFLPTFLFELRHGFHQIRTLLITLGQYGNVVSVKGLSYDLIAHNFLRTFGNILHIPEILAGIILILLNGILLYRLKHKRIFYTTDSRILLLSVTLLVGTAWIYFTVRNPIWEYHFIGVDISFLLFITYVSAKIRIFRKILAVWTIIIILISLFLLGEKLLVSQSYFEQQKWIVTSITRDAKNADYSVYAYSPSIYMYDYSYLFRWLANKDVPYDPGMIKSGKIVYLILPPKRTNLVQDFIHFRAPNQKYTLVKQWSTPANITVLKYKANSNN